jgi:hypothetical protein
MNIYKLLLASLGLFSLLNYLIIPAAKRTWASNRAIAKVSKVGVLALLNFMRTLCLIAFIAYLALLLILLIANIFGGTGTTTIELGSAVERIQSYRDRITTFRDYWGIWIFVPIVLALGIFSYRREKQHVNEQFEKILKREYERLRGEREKGLWDDLPLTSEMKEVEAKTLLAQSLLAELDKKGVDATGDAKEKRQALLLLIQSLEQRWHAIDWERRMDFTWDTDLDEPSKTHTTASAKARTFLISAGLFDSLKAVSRTLTYAGTALLFLSLLGINAPAVDYVFESRQVRLEELQVKASQEEARSSLARVQREQNDGGKRERDKEDEEILNQVAHQFEMTFATSHTWHPTYTSPETTTRVRNTLVRNQILENFKKGSPQGAEADVARAAQPGSVEDAGLDLYEKSTKAQADEPQTRLGKRVREDIKREIVEKSSGLWEQIKSKAREYVAKFGKPARIADVRDLAVGETVGALLDGFTGEDNSEVVKLFQQSTSDSLQDAAKRLYDIQFKQFLVDLAGPGSMEDALRYVSTGTKQRPAVTRVDGAQLQKIAERFPSNEGLAKNLEGHQPTLSRSLSKEQLSSEQIKKLYKTAYAAGAAQSEHTEAVAEYEDYFPGQLNSERRTTQGELLAELSPGGNGPDSLPPTDRGGPDPSGEIDPPKAGGPVEGPGGGGGGGGIGGSSSSRTVPLGPTGSSGEAISGEMHPQTSSATSMARSRSFSMLKGFARVGGVLIGQTADETPSLGVDFRDLDWSISGEDVLLTLRRSDGAEFRLGPYRKEMVNQALAFVADGRKVAVTMTSARPLLDLKVIAHPALVDSSLGASAIELDRFVDAFSGNDQHRQDAENRVNAQVALYLFAWVKSQDTLDGKLTEMNIQRPQDEGVYLEMARTPEQEKKIKTVALPALSNPEEISDPRRSLLVAKPVFFYPELVKLIASCANKNRASNLKDDEAIDNFGKCIQSEVSVAIRSADNLTLTKWIAAPPQTINWSGVRELPFSVDSQLSFLSPISGTSPAAQLWPLEFMLQTAFPSPPTFLPEGEDPAIYTDQDPWDFPELKEAIAQDVWAGLRAKPAQKAIFTKLRDFTILQRLFRVALEGRLGERFPVEKLIGLTQATSGSIVYTRTPRWTPKSGMLELSFFFDIQPAAQFSRSISEEDASAYEFQWLTKPLKALSTCSEMGGEAIRGTGQLSNLGTIPIEIWKQRCDLSAYEYEVSRKCESTSSFDSKVKPIACRIRSLILYSKEIAFARELRFALGVAKDEQLYERSSP